MRIPIIILNYNSSQDCRKCIGFLKQQEGVETEIVVVDNCSPRPGEQASIASLCKEQGCTFIQAEENRGYNAGNNIGLRYAAQQGYPYALIANPDMEFPQRDYLLRMTQEMDRRPEVAVMGSDIVGNTGNRESPFLFSSAWNEIPFLALKKIFRMKQNGPMPPQSDYCDIVHGCCLMVRLAHMEQMGFFDENLFLFCEEPTLGKQVRNINKREYYLHEATAIHRHIESQKGSFVKRYQIHAKSKRYYLRKYSGYNKFLVEIMIISRYLYNAVVITKLKMREKQ